MLLSKANTPLTIWRTRWRIVCASLRLWEDGREEDAHYFPTRSDIVLYRSTDRAIFGRLRRWQCGLYSPLIINAQWLINNTFRWRAFSSSHAWEKTQEFNFSAFFCGPTGIISFSTPSFPQAEKKRARRERRWYNMDEEYDVIVLGTGLTVSRDK